MKVAEPHSHRVDCDYYLLDGCTDYEFSVCEASLNGFEVFVVIVVPFCCWYLLIGQTTLVQYIIILLLFVI
jgi:hypothetical protein